MTSQDLSGAAKSAEPTAFKDENCGVRQIRSKQYLQKVKREYRADPRIYKTHDRQWPIWKLAILYGISENYAYAWAKEFRALHKGDL